MRYEGNTESYLLHHMKKSGFDELLSDLLQRGVLYVEVSAGSYVACPTIEAANWKHADRNIVGLEDLAGLTLVPFILTAHFEER